jgi:hypothetical protein
MMAAQPVRQISDTMMLPANQGICSLGKAQQCIGDPPADKGIAAQNGCSLECQPARLKFTRA